VPVGFPASPASLFLRMFSCLVLLVLHSLAGGAL
jgi:hypothetical protein